MAEKKNNIPIPKKKPKTRETFPRTRLPFGTRTPPKLTKTMIKMGLRREFVDPDNSISVNEGMTLGKVTNYIAGLLNSEFKKKVDEAKRDSAKAKKKKNFQGVTTIPKKKGGKVKKRK